MRAFKLTITAMLCLGPITPGWAAIQDYQVVTWNMQGASAAVESKWNTSVRMLLNGMSAPAAIVALQEAGDVPQSALLTQRTFPQAGGLPMAEYQWNLGSTSRPLNYFIYFSRVNQGANRVNLAIVSRVLADEVIVLPASVRYGRPIIGIRIGSDFFFSFHALANGGSDSGVMVAAVHDYFMAMANDRDPVRSLRGRQAQWMILGDFNRNPEDLRALLQRNYNAASNNATIVSQASSTQISGGRLDYAVLGQLRGQTPRMAAALFNAQLVGQLASDHTPVGFYPRQ
jgi:cytolethal distending toxin subunit B